MNGFYNVNKYEDIIALPRHISPTRVQMPIGDRAAQFSPFAALTGYDTAIKEIARQTERQRELDEDSKRLLNDCIRMIKERIREQPVVTVTYFNPDEKKTGGAYVIRTGRVKKINEYENRIIMSDGVFIPIERIYDLSIF